MRGKTMAESNEVKFYKLDKRKRYGAEGTQFRVYDTVLISVVLTFFVVVTVAQLVLNADVLFRDPSVTAFFFFFILILAGIITIVCVRYAPIIRRRKRARKILKDCVLTDGTVIAVDSIGREHMGAEARHHYYYYEVTLRYRYRGTDGALRYGEYSGKYGVVPFFKGQNLMIAFNENGSVILNKFTLSEGAEEFAAAEAEREKPDFSGLTGNLIKVDLSKPVSAADYGALFPESSKQSKRLKRILSGAPLFTAGRYFIKKSTYRRNSGNGQFYCYLTENGIQRTKECKGIRDIADGEEVVVAYGKTDKGYESEILKYYTVKPKRGRIGR